MSDMPTEITFHWLPEQSQLDDRVLAYQHQVHENYRMVYSREWDRLLNWLSLDATVIASIAGAFVFAACVRYVPRTWADPSWSLFWAMPVAAAVMWLTYYLMGKRGRRDYERTFARWSIDADRMLGDMNVRLSPEGIRVSTSSSTLDQTWRHYHAAVPQPNNLLLIFEGMTIVAPNAVLPMPAMDVVERINEWVVAQAKAAAEANKPPTTE